MNNKKVLIGNQPLLLLIIVILMIFSFGTITYGAFYVTKEQEKENVITATCFRTNFTDGSSISLSNALPKSDEEGMHSVPYRFSMYNDCNLTISYKVILSTVDNSFSDEFIRYSFNKKDAETLSLMPTFGEEEGYSASYVIGSGIVEKDETINDEVKLWLDENTTYESVMGSSWEGRIKIISTVYEVENSAASE